MQFPGQAPKQPLVEHEEACDFCPGHERRAMPEVYAVRDDYSTVDREGWLVRVVPNKYPAVSFDAEGVPSPREAASGKWKEAAVRESASPLRETLPGVGLHEVIVESPSHNKHFALQDSGQAKLIVETLRHRCRMVMQARDLRYACILKNHGARSGASIRHPHFQIIATAIVPHFAGLMVERQEGYMKENGRPLFDALLEEEAACGERIVAADEHFVTLAPWASQVPYEMWIVPRRPMASFADLPDDQTATFAAALQQALHRLYLRLDDPDYNLVIHNSPKGERAQRHHHWFVQVLPRFTTPAGFEWGTGVYINHVPPEEAARSLRESR
jgi:UDPglucose--hexose-1-phosphate uridylyltransferase